MYRMVVTDLDGTLLNNKKQVSEANVKAIQNLKDQNITFVMATGRSDVMTRAYTKQLKNVDIVIGCDGAVIRNIRTGEILCENHLRSETCHTTFEICKKYGLQYYVFAKDELVSLSLIHISEPTRRTPISYAVFCLKKKKKKKHSTDIRY